VTRLTVPGTGPIGPAVAYSGRVYVPDPTSGRVREVSTGGQVTNDIPIPSPTGTVELEVREGYLFINSPDGPDARVVDNEHKVHDVDKYQDGVLGGDPPPPPPAPPPPPVNVPGAPQAVTATAGDGTATITWRRASDNGAPITRYVVEGHGQPITVGAEQRQVDVTGLVNGQTYRFSVYAVNAMGFGPRAFANPVVPTRDVPDPPASVTAVENPDGSVDITWPAADGQGHPIASYRVTSISGAGVVSPVGAVTGTTLQVVPGALAYGTQYAFTVIAINDLNAASVESPASNTIIPYTVPDAPLNLGAWTDPNQRGAIQLGWQAPASNGRPVTSYEVEEENGTITQVTGTTVTLAGYPDDTAVTVRVRALNLAGAGPDATASARTMAAPAITVTGQTQGYRDISITMTPNNGGGAATCTLTIGSGVVSAPCDTAPITLTVGGLWPNNTYPFTVSITNPMGSASANGSHATNQLLARVVCGDPSYCGAGIYIYNTPSQANPGNAVGTFYGGNSFVPQCSIGGGNVNASPWGGKNTSVWLRLSYNGQTAYFPWAWATLDGGDNLGNVPVC
jgi:hypothetical protein